MSRPSASDSLTPEQQDLWRQVRALWDLAVRKDAQAIRAALHPDYAGWDMASPLPHDREAAIASVCGGTARLVAYDLQPLGVHVYAGTTGVAHYRYAATLEGVDGRTSRVSGQWTEVYVRQGPRWLMVGVSGRPDPDESGADVAPSPT